MTTRRYLIAAILVALSLAPGGCGKKKQEEQKIPNVPLRVNLLKNPSFEQSTGGIPTDWKLERFEGEGRKTNLFGISTDEKVSGAVSFYLRGVYNVTQWQVLVQSFPVIPGYRLLFSADMKSDGLSVAKGQKTRANIYVRFYRADGTRVSDRYYADSGTPYITGARDWRRYSKVTDIPKDARTGEIGLINEMTGWLYFDDVEAMIEEPIPWKEVQTKYVDFYYLPDFPFPSGAIEKETAFVEECVSKLHIKPAGTISYYYYGNEENMRKLLGVKTAHGRAAWKEKTLHTASPFDDHEIIHMLLVDLGYPPFGLAEGVVFYMLGSWQGQDLNLIAKRLLIQKELPALHGLLKQQEMNEFGLSKAVQGWASFTIWLIDRYGIDKFMKLYEDTNEVVDFEPFNERFKSIYGKDFDAVDRDWRLWVLRYQPRQ